MAELASGAVSSLLGLLQKEARLLGGVGKDVEFIREEMESMNSFLEHLSMTAHLTGGHNKQVRTWMKQVRDLAHDCSKCVDNYLQSGDRAVHLARGGLRRYVWWSYWLVQKMVAQHKAAMRLRELKERVSDVGKRRLRYGVEIPEKASRGSALTAAQTLQSSNLSRGTPEDEDDDDDTEAQTAAIAGGVDPRRRTPEPCSLDDFCAEKLINWHSLSRAQEPRKQGQYFIPSISIVVRDAEASSAATQAALDFAATHFHKGISINLKALHHSWDLPLLPQEILCYILRECKQQGTGQGKMEEKNNREAEEALEERCNTYTEIYDQIKKCTTYDKIEEVKSRIGEVINGMMEDVSSKKTEERKVSKESTGITREKPNIMRRSLEQIMQEAAKNVKQHMETLVTDLPFRLDDFQYQDILQKVVLDSKSPPDLQSGNNKDNILDNNDIIEILNNHKIAIENHRIALDNHRIALQQQLSRTQALGGNSLKEQAKGVLPGHHHKISTTDATITEMEEVDGNSGEVKANKTMATSEETKEKVEEILEQIGDLMFINGIVHQIKLLLETKRTLIILIDDGDYISKWEEIKDALNLLAYTNGNAVVVITRNSDKANEFCCAPGEPINYSLIGLYHDICLQTTTQGDNETGINNSKILYDILDKCDPNEFSMRVFTHALYANPNRTFEDLHRLHGALQIAKNSATVNANITKVMLKFSYRDLPREHKTCLLYLAIFPQGHIFKRSTLIERWSIEGLIIKEDWPTVVRHGKRCFEALIQRWLVMPIAHSAGGKVKNCMVDRQVHEFITKIANKEHILDPRLSQLQARHFSTFSGLRMRASDNINTVVQKLPKYLHKLRLLKLLDLEGCHALEKKHLKEICSNILHLKYLSLRGTDIDDLPTEINNLHELEVLDIRKTKVPEHATRGIVLLKMRRLLGGTMVSGTINPSHSAIQIPYKINKMDNIEVLSYVKAYSKYGAELKEVRKLGHLRKLGVVINNKKSHLKYLLWAISDLKECLQSLSITIDGSKTDSSPPEQDLLRHDLYNNLITPHKVLESLSLDGFTDIVRLLTLFSKCSNELHKVTLSRTRLVKRNLIHTAILPKLQCIRLRHDAYIEKALTFDYTVFLHIKNLFVEHLQETEMINFKNRSAPELEKIVLLSTGIKCLCGVGALPKLKELELKNNKLLVLYPENATSYDEPKISEDGRASARLSEAGIVYVEKYLTKDGLVPAEPTISELGTTSVEPMISEDGRASTRLSEEEIVYVEKYLPKDEIVPAEPSISEVGTTSAEPITPTGEMTSTYPTTKGMLIFKKGGFQHLKYFLVEGPSKQTHIKFEGGAPELEKIVLFDTNIESLDGVGGLAKLREINFKGNKTVLSYFLTANHITKVTLTDTNLKLDDLKGILAKKPKLCWLELLDNSYDDERQLIFDKHEFPKLKFLIVKCSMISSIRFTQESACKIEKIIWSFTKLVSLSGIHYLPKLKELEFKGDSIPLDVRKDISAHNINLIHNKPHLQDKINEEGSTQ